MHLFFIQEISVWFCFFLLLLRNFLQNLKRFRNSFFLVRLTCHFCHSIQTISKTDKAPCRPHTHTCIRHMSSLQQTNNTNKQPTQANKQINKQHKQTNNNTNKQTNKQTTQTNKQHKQTTQTKKTNKQTKQTKQTNKTNKQNKQTKKTCVSDRITRSKVIGNGLFLELQDVKWGFASDCQQFVVIWPIDLSWNNFDSADDSHRFPIVEANEIATANSQETS